MGYVFFGPQREGHGAAVYDSFDLEAVCIMCHIRCRLYSPVPHILVVDFVFVVCLAFVCW